MIHLVIALERIRAGEPCREAMNGLPEMEDSRQEARQLISLLEAEFGLEFPDPEVDAVALHLRGSKLTSAGNRPDAHQEEILELARCFIEGFPGEQAALLGTDGQFIQGLVSHLEPTVIRLRNGLPIYNPLLKTLREQYPDLFERTRQAAGAMERRLGMRLSDEEIGFLTMHAGACFERAGQQHGRRVKAAVVCASGIGVSALLCARLEKTFGAQMDLEALSA
ncbi:BglG family transcription antiterminator, partial [Faecalibaculum rodentium]|uniref:BglG family transcription antiterminator n=1 Tax=Faecalibaculum rodentium TaxID=1702221 RepID=UPI002608FF4C